MTVVSLIFSSPSCPGNQATEIDKVRKLMFTEHLQYVHFPRSQDGMPQACSQHSQTLTNHMAFNPRHLPYEAVMIVHI